MMGNLRIWGILGCLTMPLASASLASAGDLFNDVFRVGQDQQRINNDEQRLLYDVSHHPGNVTNDLNRLNYDEGRLQRDESRLQYDTSGQPYYPGGYTTGGGYVGGGYTPPVYSSQSQALQPHPQYPGYYYYPSNPGQLYYYPGQTAPAASTPTATASVAAPTITAPSTTMATNSRPVQKIAVKFVNPEEFGVAMNFAVDGIAQSVPSGFTQSLDATSTSVIEFNRGEGLGNARYTLSPGTYEFQYGDSGWQCFKKSSPGLIANIGNSVPTNSTPRRQGAMPGGLTRNNSPATSVDATDSQVVPTTFRNAPPAPMPARSAPIPPE